jgi:poly(A) polymerase
MTMPPLSLDTPRLKTAASVVERLRRRGHEAYLVGGCVRDLLMGMTPQEADIATSARPDVVEEIFSNTVAVGAQFGVVLVIENDMRFEIATFRTEGASSDGRHPDSVLYAHSAEEDSARRDFTINALFYDPASGALLDFHGGQEDIRQKIIRAIGHPRERFQEDKLRLLRAVRFAVRFGFELESRTRQSIVELAPEICRVSAERVREELTRILREGNSHRGFLLLDELGLLRHILPELEKMKGIEQPPEFHPEGDVWVHTMQMLKLMDETKGRESGARGQKVEGTGRKSDDENQEGPSLYNDTYPPAILAWAVLFHDVGKPATFERLPDRIRFNGHMEVGAGIARQIGRRLRMSNDEIEAIAELVLDHLKFKDVFKMKTSTLKRFVRRERFLEHLELHRLDCLASHGNLDAYHFVRDFGSSLKPEDARPKLFLNGNDLMDLGYTPGPEFKKILTALEDAQLESLITDRETALEFLKHAFPLP